MQLPRLGTKQALLLDMLRGDAGASVRELVAATGWKANTVHSALATFRKSGCQIIIERNNGCNRYRMQARQLD
jgi:DNA-binding IclR family transcriptional regulator